MTDYTDLLTQAEQKYGLPAGILTGQMTVESGGNPNAKSPKGAIGLMQFTPATAKLYGVDPTDPVSSIDGAARFMADNLKAANGNVGEALRLYQGGPNRAGWGKENAAYAGKVLSAMPGDSGDLAAMGLTAAANPSGTTVDDHADLSAAGLTPADDKALQAARAEITGATSTAGLTASSNDIQDGVNKIVKAGGDKNTVMAFLAQNGMDPAQTKIDDATINWSRSTGKPITVYQPGEIPAAAGQGKPSPSIQLQPLQPSDSNLTNLAVGGRQGVEDVGAAGAGFSKWVDDHVPALAALDQATANAGIMDTPAKRLQGFGLDKAIYDQTAGKTLMGAAGRLGGQVLTTAPAIAAGGALAGAGLETAGLGGTANFLAGNAGGNLLTRGASLAANGALTGGAFNALTDQPVGQGMAAGALLAPVGGAVGKIAGKAYGALSPIVKGPANLLSDAVGASNPNRVALNRLTQRIAQDTNAGGPTAQDMLATLAANPDKPLMLADVGGDNLTNFAGRMARAPGESRGIITSALNSRDEGAATRIANDIRSNISSGGSAYDTTQSLMAKRATDAAPLYDKAFQGGSVAPLEHQFQQAFADSSGQVGKAEKALRDAQNAATQSKAGVSRAGDNVYGANSALRNDQGAQGAVTSAERDLASAQATHQANLERLRQAQADGSANAPGAVWSPRIQQFLDDPIMQGGLRRGLEIQRLESVAAGKPFNPSEYAITGTDAAGNPMVGAVPNMRQLDAGKRGLDAIIADHTDDVTGKVDEYGRAVTQFKNAYVKQLDDINPDYKDARAAFSGPSGSMDAVRQGRQILTQRPEVNRDRLASLSDGDKEFFKQGAADALLEKIARTSAGGDESKRIIGNDYVQQQLRPLFDSDAEMQKFIGSVRAEANMYATRQAVLGGSQTGGRVAEDASPASQAAISGFHFARSAASGHVPGVIGHGMNMLQALADRRNPLVNASAANLLTQGSEGATNTLQAIISRNAALQNGSPSVPSVFSGYRLPATTAVANRLLAQRTQK